MCDIKPIITFDVEILEFQHCIMRVINTTEYVFNYLHHENVMWGCWEQGQYDSLPQYVSCCIIAHPDHVTQDKIENLYACCVCYLYIIMDTSGFVLSIKNFKI